MDGNELQYDNNPDMLNEDDAALISQNIESIRQIDEKKVPEESTIEKVESGDDIQKPLSIEDARKEYELYRQNYYICPCAVYLQQMGRSAMDIVDKLLLTANANSVNIDELMKYVLNGINCYITLLFYVASRESKLDCCYWISKCLTGLADFLMKREQIEYAQHCYKLAYVFANKGLSYEVENSSIISEHKEDNDIIVNKLKKSLNLN